MITSSSNSQIKNIIALQKKAKARNEQGLFVVEGLKMFEEAKKLELLSHTYVSETFLQEFNQQSSDLLKDTEYEVVADKVFCEMADTMTPQGVIASVKKSFYQLENILALPDANLLLLEDIRDPGNLGTMIRTAEAAGISGVILTKESVDIYNPKVVRSTMGSIFRLPIFYVDNFHEILMDMVKQNFQLFATHLRGIKNYDVVNYKGKCGIIIGNEAHGITDRTADIATHLVKIPMSGEVESLNAAIAAAVMMYEAYRQRRIEEFSN